MSEAEFFCELAARCRRLARASFDFELSAELKEIADELTARAEELERTKMPISPGHLNGEPDGEIEAG